MNDNLEQKNITISGIEDKGWGISLIDEKGLKYNVSKYLKGTQNETKAFQVLKALAGYGMGLRRCVKFATVPNSAGGQSRYVRIIGEVEEEGQKGINTHYEPKNAPQGNLGRKNEPLSSQSEDIRANVALKMISECLTAGVIPLNEWQRWADIFYNYKPNTGRNMASEKEPLTEEELNSISINDL